MLAAAAKAKRKATAKAIIFLHQWGGPGQHETFDPKPDAPDNVRGWYGATKTKIPGVIFGERIPKLAAMADKFTVIRCLQHNMKNHNSAGYYSLTGIAPPTDDQRLRDSIELFPAYGSIVDKLAPAPKGTATFVASRTSSPTARSRPASTPASSARATTRCSSTRIRARPTSSSRNSRCPRTSPPSGWRTARTF